MKLVTFRCALTGESQSMILCEACADSLAPLSEARSADPECECETCPRPAFPRINPHPLVRIGLTMTASPPRRPPLTRAVMDGLVALSNDALVMLDERQGHNEHDAARDAGLHRAAEWIDALRVWFDAHHPPVAEATEPAAPAAAPVHDPDCVFPAGHDGDCATIAELGLKDPADDSWLTRPKR